MKIYAKVLNLVKRFNETQTQLTWYHFMSWNSNNNGSVYDFLPDCTKPLAESMSIFQSILLYQLIKYYNIVA